MALFFLVALLPLVSLFCSLLSLEINDYLLDWFREREVFTLTADTFLMALAAALIALGIGLPTGLALGSIKGKVLSWRLLFFLPLAVPPYLAASCWTALLGKNGVVPEFFGGEQAGLLNPFWGSAMVLGFCYFPVVVYIIMSGMRGLGRQFEEAAMLVMSDGKVVGRIILPLLKQHIITGFLFVFLLSATNYSVPALLGYKTLTIKIYTYFALFQNISGAFYLAMPLLLVSIIVVGLLERCMGGGHVFSMDRHYQGSSLPLLRGSWYQVCTTVPVVLVTLAPIIYLLVRAGSAEVIEASYGQVRETLYSTMWLTMIGSLAISLLAFPTGYLLDRIPFFRLKTVRGIFLLPFALPSILLAAGLILVWNRPWLQWGYDSAFVLVLLWGVKFLPLAQRIVADHINQVPRQLEEAAQVCGLSWIQGVRRIVWPLSRGGFLVTWAVVYIFCLAELGGTLLVIPPGVDSLPIRLYNIMHYGASSLVAGIGLIILLMAVVPLAPLYVYGKMVKNNE